MEKTWKDEEYQGWTNYYTWNVALFLNNEYSFYQKMVAFREECANGNYDPTYDDFLEYSNLKNRKTMDGVAFADSRLDKEQLIKDCIFTD